MFNPLPSQRPLLTLFGWAVGGIGFLLSFGLALTMLVRQGNPGFLLIWLAAAGATAACMRAHARWRKACERMCNPEDTRSFRRGCRRSWRQDVEEVSFRDMPAADMAYGR